MVLCGSLPSVLPSLHPAAAAALLGLQETVKGSQGAGKVDEALDRGAKADRGESDAAAAAPSKPAMPPGKAPKGKGGRR